MRGPVLFASPPPLAPPLGHMQSSEHKANGLNRANPVCCPGHKQMSEHNEPVQTGNSTECNPINTIQRGRQSPLMGNQIQNGRLI